MSKHTAGTWSPEFSETVSIRDCDGGRIAGVFHLKGRSGMSGRRDIGEVEANAHLIAAAPELLEALINLLKACNNADAHGDLSEFIDENLLGDAEEIIAKAKGEQA